MRTYIFAAILSFGLIGCGGGGGESVSEDTILNRPPVNELAGVNGLNGHLIFSDYTLDNGIALLDKQKLKMTVSNDGDLTLHDERGQKIVATGKVAAADNIHNYNVTLRFNDHLSNDLFKEGASSNLSGKEYRGHGNYDRTFHTFTMRIEQNK